MINNKVNDFVLINDIIPNIVIDIRYYSTFNFVGHRIDGYEEPCAILTKKATDALKKVNKELLLNGL